MLWVKLHLLWLLQKLMTALTLISCFMKDVNMGKHFSFSELRYSLLEFKSRKIWEHLTN